MPTFKNTPNHDFANPSHRAALHDALLRVDELVQQHKLRALPMFGGSLHESSEVIFREDPSHCSTRLGDVHYATPEQVDCALTYLQQQTHPWRNVATRERVQMTLRLADIIEEQRCMLAALMIRESGKPWKEADADVSEAIDFCRYYAGLMEELDAGSSIDLPGQENTTSYWPRGRVAVIAPWNFPLAILCGMTIGALVTGNQAVIKPAEQSSLVGFEFVRALELAGFPPSSFAFLPGAGDVVGKMLVESPAIDMICFTGSKEVGLQIIESAAKCSPRQRSIKKVIAEMGGKNCIIVDSDADLDAAVAGIIYSSFGYAGQKCSACSRVIVVGDHYDRVCTRLQEAARDLQIGPSANPETIVGPLIDEESRHRVLQKIAKAETEAKLLFKGEAPSSGHFVPVTIFKDVTRDSSIWKEELFAPVLAIARANSFFEAVLTASDSEFALTGAVFSRHPDHIEYAKKHFEVGNLYINQGTTGALVARQPFGGFKLSGCGAKAGGHNYLLQFLNERTVTENTMRKGYTPELA
jgi:RHH-type proline utilization regulon transcriptional repressor/proline dehydrogenase/delta 1-pyrroline-5-carboxylate dehydrogenase